MPWKRTLCGALALTALAAMLAAGSGTSSPARTFGCGVNYKYSGNQDPAARSGIRAKISTIALPSVISGHTAGWVGVGGPGLGPHGADEWVQTGYSAFTTGQKQIYYEVTQPGVNPTYHVVKSVLGPDEVHNLGVLESAGKQGIWRVWMDNRPISPEISLPGSHAKFAPQAIGESWNDGATTCNSYDYGFAGVQVANAPGGAWTFAHLFGHAYQDKTNETIKQSATGFETKSRSLTSNARSASAKVVPPLLGFVASKLSGEKLTAECVKQKAAIREQPAGHLLISDTVCQTLIGYGMAQPHVPKPGSPAGKFVARTALAYLRGVEQVAPTGPANADCNAVTEFSTALPALGATPAQSRALRKTLLADNAHVVPKLSLGADCPFQVPGSKPKSPTAPFAPPPPFTPPPPPPPAPAATPAATPAAATPTPPTKSAQSVSFGGLPGAPFGGLPDTTFGAPDFTISAASSSGLPVSFSATGACTITGATVHITGAGTCSITATQAGDNSFAPASVTATFAIAKAGQAITFGPLADKTAGDPDFAVSATAGSGLAVTFAASGDCTVTGSTVHLTGAGSCSITASQAGNANYNAAASVTRSFSIAAAVVVRGTVEGHGLKPTTGGTADFTVGTGSPAAGPHGHLNYDPPGSGPNYNGTTITDVTIASDGRSATISGVDAGGVPFTAYVEDNGGPGPPGAGDPDVFVLRIGGVLQTGDGSLSDGRIDISLDPPGP